MAGSLTHIYALYKHLLPTLGGYINNGGTADMGRLETYVRELSRFEATVCHPELAGEEYVVPCPGASCAVQCRARGDCLPRLSCL